MSCRSARLGIASRTRSIERATPVRSPMSPGDVAAIGPRQSCLRRWSRSMRRCSTSRSGGRPDDDGAGRGGRPNARAVNRANRYAVEYDPRAVKELSKLDKTVARRIFTAIDALAAEPRPAGCRAFDRLSGPVANPCRRLPGRLPDQGCRTDRAGPARRPPAAVSIDSCNASLERRRGGSGAHSWVVITHRMAGIVADG